MHGRLPARRAAILAGIIDDARGVLRPPRQHGLISGFDIPARVVPAIEGGLPRRISATAGTGQHFR
jgi:hypothetical protein